MLQYILKTSHETQNQAFIFSGINTDLMGGASKAKFCNALTTHSHSQSGPQNFPRGAMVECVCVCVSLYKCVHMCMCGNATLAEEACEYIFVFLNSRIHFKMYQTFTAVNWASVSLLAVALVEMVAHSGPISF